ncbi:MAG TPA: MaoC family dehydratase [Dehalococcoidia bacterium]|nr:MaoC family dehydratase [Dehalococcoidia bacterium]
MTSLDALPKGFRFPATALDLQRDWVNEYIAATEDETTGDISPEAVPPMALAALAIRTLLNNARLPEGAIHASQEIECLRPVKKGERVLVQAEILNKGERQGWGLLTVRFTLEGSAGEQVMTGRATLSMPLGTATEASS